MKWWWLFVGGGAGAVARHALAVWVTARAGLAFPWGTFAVNAIGCLAIGLLAALADEGRWLSPNARLMLVTGVLGGFTTFSAFGLETMQLLLAGQRALALLNVFGSVAVALVAVGLGEWLARQVL